MNDTDTRPAFGGGQGRTDEEIHGAGVIMAIALGTLFWFGVLLWAFA